MSILNKCSNPTCFSDGTCSDGKCPIHTTKVKRKLAYSAGKTSPKTQEIHLGVEIECFAPSENVHRAMLSQSKTPCQDGSLPDMGCEFKFCHPIAMALWKLPRFVRRLEEIGAQVNHKCGLHVHLDARFASSERISSFLGWLASFQDWWFSIMPASRQNNTYVKRIPSFDRYGWASKTRYSTVEIRIHGGTLSPYKLKGWLRAMGDLAELLNGTEAFPEVTMGADGKPTSEFLRKVFKNPEGFNYVMARQQSGGSLASTSATPTGPREEVA